MAMAQLPLADMGEFSFEATKRGEQTKIGFVLKVVAMVFVHVLRVVYTFL